MAAVVATATVLLEPLGALRRGIKTAGREGGRLQLGIMVTLGLGILYLSSSKHRFKLMGPYYETLCLFFFFMQHFPLLDFINATSIFVTAARLIGRGEGRQKLKEENTWVLSNF